MKPASRAASVLEGSPSDCVYRGRKKAGHEKRKGRIIQLRFGLMDGHPRTLEEVGREFGVTRERIRQIESKTLAKLRHPGRAQLLREYLG